MKWWLLKKVDEELKKSSVIFNISRVGDNLFYLVFDKSPSMLFDLANKNIEICPKKPISKHYNATVDVWLSKNCSKAKLCDVRISPIDKILELHIQSQNSYKSENFTLRFEFIPPRGSFCALINSTVICALRYDDRIKLKHSIIEPSQPKRLPDEMPDYAKELDLQGVFHTLLENFENKKLASLKERKREFFESKIAKLNEQINELESSDDLLLKSSEAYNIAKYLETNLHNITSKYIQELKLTLGHEKSIGEWKDFYYQKSKKLKQKAAGVSARFENLEQKITFWQNLKALIENANSENEIISLDPPKNRTSKQKDDDWHEVFYKDAKIMIGKNAAGNEKLLKLAKATDLWLHLQSIASAHVIIKGKGIKEDVIAYGAKLCASFSNVQQGLYLVDYTSRQNVSPVSGANVRYINYKSIQVMI